MVLFNVIVNQPPTKVNCEFQIRVRRYHHHAVVIAYILVATPTRLGRMYKPDAAPAFHQPVYQLDQPNINWPVWM